MSKLKELLQIKFTKLTPSESVTDYITKRIGKHENESREIIGVICNVNKESARAGKTYTITIEVMMNQSGFIVREKGKDLYQVIDMISDKFRKRLTKFTDKQTTSYFNDTEIFSYQNQYSVSDLANEYTHFDGQKSYSIIEKKGYYDNSPLHLEEAIEMMEMIGRDCFLFKNIETGRYSVVYRIKSESSAKQAYGLLEHRSG